VKIDPKRYKERSFSDSTGIYVRAQVPNRQWESVDIAELDYDSLMQWLRSRGGSNEWAENTVALLLGHEVRKAAE